MMKTVRMLGIAALFLLLTASLSAFDNMNRQIGIIYLRNAAANYLTGNYEASSEFLEKAKEFHSASSDYEYLTGLIKLEKENKINDAVESFKKALGYENWMLLEKKKCVADLALLLFRTKEYKALIEIIEQKAYPDYSDNDLMYLYLLSMKYDGQTVKYRETLKRSIIRYSEDYRFAEIYLYEDISYRDEILSGLRTFKNEEGGLSVYLKAAMTLENGIDRKNALQNYFDEGGNDISALIEFYRLTGLDEEEQLDVLLEKNLFEIPSYRKRLNKIIAENSMREKLDEAWNSYTGNIYYDLNKDGYFEELHLYENGRPLGISIDNNQDGIIEVMMIFENGSPSELILINESYVRISYDHYPVIKELSISEGSERMVYTFLKNRVNLDSYYKRVQDDKLVFLFNETDSFIDGIDRLKDYAVRVSTYSGGGEKDSFGYLEQELERRTESYTVLKIYNRIVGNYVYQQYNDIRTSGFADIDFDNLIDIKETYKDGNIIAVEADDNKNGSYDYKLTFNEGYPVSWWDFNEDGVYDCRQYEKNGVLINEYSSELDGVFDIIERN